MKQIAATGLSLLVLLTLAVLVHGQDEEEPKSKAPKTIAPGRKCTHCHGKLTKGKEVVHAPARSAEECLGCHEQKDATLHEFKYPAPPEKLCFECHEDMKLDGTQHEPVKKGECLSCHDAHASNYPKLIRTPMQKLCAHCHESMKAKLKKHVHGPFGLGMCQACHDPHASPNAQLLKGAGSELCLKCHDQLVPEDAEAATWHEPAKEDCGGCHSGHDSDHEFMLKSAQPQICFDCHKPLGDRLAKSKVKHKAVTEGSRCGGCHDPHVSSYTRLLKTEAGNLCLSCHDKAYPQGKKRPLPDYAKLLKDNPKHHGPVKEKNCEGCHKPHASDHFRLLNKSYPARFYAPFKKENYALCFECHNERVILDKESVLTGFRDGNRNLHFLHVNRKKGRTCRACHETHASGLPHHIRKTTPFGEWNMPMGYKKEADGGTCASGCHVPKTYRRGDQG